MNLINDWRCYLQMKTIHIITVSRLINAVQLEAKAPREVSKKMQLANQRIGSYF